MIRILLQCSTFSSKVVHIKHINWNHSWAGWVGGPPVIFTVQDQKVFLAGTDPDNMLAFICWNTSRWIWEQQTCVILLRHWPGTFICRSGSSCVYLCVLNVCCVFVCICFESNVCVWPCCSPDPLLVSIHVTQFSANWIIYDDSSYIALYHWNTIYCFIALDHQFIICTNQLLSYSHLCKLDHHQLLLSRSLYQDFKCCPLLFPHFQFKSICVKRAKTKASQI